MSVNILKVGATRKGKSLSAAGEIVASPSEAAVVFDPHKQSLAETIVTHAVGNILFERLSNVRDTLGFELLRPSVNPDPMLRHQENLRRAEGFTEILLRRRGTDGMAASPLMEEWCMAALMLWLFQASAKPLALLPFAFLPGTTEFTALVRDCALPEFQHKFRQIEKLAPRALRAEVGSAARLLTGVFRSPAFVARSRGGFDLGRFLQNRGKLIVERGEEIGDDAMRTIMGAIVLLTIDHAKRRPKPFPHIRIYMDEATNARLVGPHELRGIAETNKNGLYWEFLVQNLDFPGGAEGVLQNCHRHEWFGCPSYDLARKAAIDIVARMAPDDDASRTQRLAEITHEVMSLPAGWRWVCDGRGAWKEYVPLLDHPWPDWPGLREAKLQEQLRCIHSRPEYRSTDKPDANGPPTASSRPTKPPASDSPASRLKRRGRKRVDGSGKNGGAGESA